MAAAALLAVTLVPVLMGYFVRGRILPERKNPLSRLLVWGYRPLYPGGLALQGPYPGAGGAGAVRHGIPVPRPGAGALCSATRGIRVTGSSERLGTLFPIERIWAPNSCRPLYEGDLLYMPTTLPGVSVGQGAASCCSRPTS